eukprot:11198847-Lingulodinium_polyedra.AAC.1
MTSNALARHLQCVRSHWPLQRNASVPMKCPVPVLPCKSAHNTPPPQHRARSGGLGGRATTLNPNGGGP